MLHNDTPQIHATKRWTRQNDAWIEIDCYRFEYADGRRLYADTLTAEQREVFDAQHSEHKDAA